jgi:hypothetical protein
MKAMRHSALFESAQHDPSRDLVFIRGSWRHIDGPVANDDFAELSAPFDLLLGVPRLLCMPRDVPLETIDHDEAFVLALIDGRTTIEQIARASAMPMPSVLGILEGLLDSEIITLCE